MKYFRLQNSDFRLELQISDRISDWREHEELGLGNAVKRLRDRLWQRHTHEVAARVQIAFAGFIDDADQVVSRGEIVFDNGIEFAQFERSRIVTVADTDGELATLRIAPFWRMSAAGGGGTTFRSDRRQAS